MATIQDRETFGRARLSFAREADIDEFVTLLAKFESGDIGPDEWRAFRLLRGTYGQRQIADAQMLRIKIPQGILTRPQLDALADVAERYSRGFGHITTRQNIQLHFVKLHDAEPAMRELAAAGMTTREACGNSVRNITACPFSGVAHDEAFDVTPYAEALTRYLLRHPLSSVLPRKFKIAFEGCANADHIGSAINDIGWTGRVQNTDGREVRGFKVTVAGGTATMTRAGNLLHEFLPVEEMFDCAEAIIRVFHRLGDYKHKQKNRLKFLVKALGWDGFKVEYERERAELLTRTAALPFDPSRPPVESAPDWEARRAISLAEIASRATATAVIGPGIVPKVEPRLVLQSSEFAEWSRTNVRPQKQDGYSVAIVTTVLGDLTSAQFRLIGELSEIYGDGTIRVTMDQNLLFRWVRNENVESFYKSLAAAGFARPGAGTLSDVTSCPGAESCKLAVTQSRGLGRVLSDYLLERPDHVAEFSGMDIKISGCPNGCGQHHIAGIGFQGSLKKVGKDPAPQYFVMVGGGTGDGITTFGRLAAKVPARRCVQALDRLVKLYQDQRADRESALAFFRRVDLAAVKAVLGDLERLTPEEAEPQDFIDLAEVSAFNPEVMEGECSA